MGDHLNFVSLKSKSFMVLTFWIFFRDFSEGIGLIA